MNETGVRSDEDQTDFFTHGYNRFSHTVVLGLVRTCPKTQDPRPKTKGEV